MAKNKDTAKSTPSAVTVPEASDAERLPSPEEVRAMLQGAQRKHFEGLGMPWAVLLGGAPQQLMPQVVATVLQEGGTRPSWRWNVNKTDFVLMAWPKDQPTRAAVVMAGPEGGKLRPLDAAPFIEGLPNDLIIAEVHPWQVGTGGNVAATMEEGRNPMWFYDPVYERDLEKLTPGVTQTILLAGLAFSVRKALLDEITVTKGPQFEVHAEAWLAENPGKSRLDVPPLKFPLAGRHLIMPGKQFCEYQIRAKIEQVDECELEKMNVKILYLSFPFDNRPNMELPLYVPASILKEYEPAEGEEIDAYIWLEGRINDQEPSEPAQTEPEHISPLQ